MMVHLGKTKYVTVSGLQFIWTIGATLFALLCILAGCPFDRSSRSCPRSLASGVVFVRAVVSYPYVLLYVAHAFVTLAARLVDRIGLP